MVPHCDNTPSAKVGWTLGYQAERNTIFTALLGNPAEDVTDTAVSAGIIIGDVNGAPLHRPAGSGRFGSLFAQIE